MIYDPSQERDWTEGDSVLPMRPGLDVSALTAEGAKSASRTCRHCSGAGFVPVFDPDYDGSAVIRFFGPNSEPCQRAGRIMAYCECAYGRWVMINHEKTAKDVFVRTPDFLEIKGRSSYWLEHDPTERDLTEDEIARLPESFRKTLAERMRVSRTP